MAPSSKTTAAAVLATDKPRLSIRLTPDQSESMANTIKDVREHFGAVLASLGSLTAEQQADVLAHSPLLAELKALTEPLRG